MKLLIKNFKNKIYWFRVRNILSDFLKNNNQQKNFALWIPKEW